jgi:hypothetical protein
MTVLKDSELECMQKKEGNNKKKTFTNYQICKSTISFYKYEE